MLGAVEPARGPAVGPGPEVTFGDARRPETATRVRLPEFEGPLGLLLALIESRQLDILTVPLGTLAGAYLEALARLEGDRLGNLSTFVAVAGQLILIKSRAMLPRRVEAPETPEDELLDPEAELRARLILYRIYRDAGAALQAGALERSGSFHREPAVAGAAGRAGAAHPPLPPLPASLLVSTLEGLLRTAPPPAPPAELFARAITISDCAELIRTALRTAPMIVLQELLRDVNDRVVVAVTFLALLELMKRREIVVEQAAPWGPILARSATPAERGAGGSVVSPDVPLDETLESFA